MSYDATPAKVRLTEGLGRLLDGWAEASGNVFHHGETLRGVSRDDLLTLMSSVEAAMRERCAQMVAGEKFRDGKQDARRGPGAVGTWHESSPMRKEMKDTNAIDEERQRRGAALAAEMREALEPRAATEVAAELRRLYAENEALREVNETFGKRQEWWNDKMVDLEAQRDALLEALKEIVDAADGAGWEQIDPSFKKARAAIKAVEERQ